MSDFRKYLEKQLSDEKFKKEWTTSAPEYDLMRSLIDAVKENPCTAADTTVHGHYCALNDK